MIKSMIVLIRITRHTNYGILISSLFQHMNFSGLNSGMASNYLKGKEKYLYIQIWLLETICNVKSIKIHNRDVINVFIVLVVLKIMRETECCYLCHIIYVSNSIKDQASLSETSFTQSMTSFPWQANTRCHWWWLDFLSHLKWKRRRQTKWNPIHLNEIQLYSPY